MKQEVENDGSSLRLESIQLELVFERVLGVNWLRLMEEPFDSLISRFDLRHYENIVHCQRNSGRHPESKLENFIANHYFAMNHDSVIRHRLLFLPRPAEVEILSKHSAAPLGDS